jgi:hypothetical protein
MYIIGRTPCGFLTTDDMRLIASIGALRSAIAPLLAVAIQAATAISTWPPVLGIARCGNAMAYMHAKDKSSKRTTESSIFVSTIIAVFISIAQNVIRPADNLARGLTAGELHLQQANLLCKRRTERPCIPRLIIAKKGKGFEFGLPQLTSSAPSAQSESPSQIQAQGKQVLSPQAGSR